MTDTRPVAVANASRGLAGRDGARLSRRAVLLGGVAAASAWPLTGCKRQGGEWAYDGGWVGADLQRGHRLRDMARTGGAEPALQRRAGVIVVGGGVAGLACARALVRSGVDDVHVFDLEDSVGGNSRGHRIAGMDCPLGAHYLPVPDERDAALLALLEEFGLCRVEHGRWVFDERHLCHSPQERVFVDGEWQDGLLPVHGQDADTLAEYRRFSALVAEAARTLGFRLPTVLAPWTPGHQALDGVTFAAWLESQGLRSAPLRTYLDYCCRDDFGAGAAQVSAWAGLHYFASRHGFHAPGMPAENELHEAVLTWPQGNAWLTNRLAAPLGDRLHTGQLALRVQAGRHDTSVDVWNARADRVERWTAPQLVLATPVFIGARLLASSAAPAALSEAASRMRYAPWLVANLHLGEALDESSGAPMAWDNVVHGSALLGYVDAMHQSTRPHGGATVLTSYWALGGNSPSELNAARRRLMEAPWATWARDVVADLSGPHPDLPSKLRRVDLMRYGHAMSIPVPGVRGSEPLRALRAGWGRLHFAHSDLSGYSVFEEAFFHGEDAARRVRLALRA